jgi:hypothetical protein
MMIGITAWQQQVPLPQSYTGANARFQGSSGHPRVNVRAYLPSDAGASRVNGSVSHRCEVLAR